MRKLTPSQSSTVRDAFSSKVVTTFKTLYQRAGTVNRLIAAALTVFGAVVGCLGLAGITHLPIITHVIHPGAEQILSQARTATYHDMLCTHTEVYLNQMGSWPGQCIFTSNPERAWFRFDVENPPTDASYFMLFDGTTIYTKSPNQTKWLKGSNGCQPEQPCPPAFLESLNSLYNVTSLQFAGVDSIRNTETYHLQGQLQSPSLSSTAMEDLWIAQDNYYPVRLIVHDATFGGDPIPPTSYTLDFSAYNGDMTIPLPTSDQIQNLALAS